MNSIFQFETLLPISLLIAQAFTLILIFTSILKKMQLLKTPYAGMEYSQVFTVAAFLFGVIFISTADTTATFQSFKTFQNAKVAVFANTFAKFSQFFLVIVFFEMIFSLLCSLIANFYLGYKKARKEISEGNIPASILIAVIIIGLSVVLQPCAKEIIQYITPQYLTFR